MMTAFLARACAFFIAFTTIVTAAHAETDSQRLGDNLQPLLSCLSGRSESFSVVVDIDVLIDGKVQHVDGRLVRFDDHSFDLDLIHSDYSVRIRRRPGATAFALPHHKTVFLGSGDVDVSDQLSPLGITDRLVGSGSMLTMVVPMLQQTDSAAVGHMLTGLLKMDFNADRQHWTLRDDTSLQFHNDGKQIEINVGDQHRAALTIQDSLPEMAKVDDWSDFKIVVLKRQELERSIARGTRRALEILSPSRLLTSPQQKARKVPAGELRWIEGQRIVLLNGTPEEIGDAHGRLLSAESQRCIDSVLYTFGTVNTIRTGRWFRHDLDAAYARLAPHIPEDHKRETLAFAKAINIDPSTAHAINVFPELFHCSGFAVSGAASKDGKLYHGRVLDYMTTIGLQDAATTFIVAVDGKHAFANIGYAGFIGSVSGMNDQAISLGEMGGHGEGQWDGVPMATLMRRALEECSTLDDVMTLWHDSPRTCEYYYVFADGKSKRAVGVAADPNSIEFIMPGQSDQRLGEGIPEVLALSSGSRLEALRERIQQRYGEIDVEVAQWLMSRPVAMKSNLHNVLFIPEDGVFYVANATHQEPAANRPYVKLDLDALLRSMTP
ncbi:C45 family autoproteolytic acyltransferase/hydolase [Novipirellula sp. SH528]|uniref:C45 family autoproteolytic acyltransferase/hydolase n=1 Tax=Novipirellula sp. SH528 TaxID=3454466 RepID=UPI003F9EE3C4